MPERHVSQSPHVAAIAGPQGRFGMTLLAAELDPRRRGDERTMETARPVPPDKAMATTGAAP